MPGSPYPALGSTALTLAISVVAAATAVVATRWLDDRGLGTRTLTALVSVPYAVSALAVWAGARHWGPVVFPDYQGPLLLAAWLVGAFAVVTLQVAVPVYAFARWRLLVALPALFLSTAATWYQFLLVNGETDVLWLWVIAFGPLLVVGTLALFGIEAGVRRVAGS